MQPHPPSQVIWHESNGGELRLRGGWKHDCGSQLHFVFGGARQVDMLGIGKPGSFHFATVPLLGEDDGATTVSTFFCLLVVSSLVLGEISSEQSGYSGESQV